MPKPLHESRRVIVVDAMARDHRDLDHVLAEIDAAFAIFERQRYRNTVGDDLARNDADRLRRWPLPSRDKIAPARRDAP